MNRVLCLVAAVVMLGGCSSADSDEDSRPAASPSVDVTPSSAAAETETTESSAPATPAPTTNPEDAIRNVAQAYSDAFLTGDGKGAYSLLSERCQARNAEADFVAEVASAGEIYGQALAFETFAADVNGEQARVTYTYADSPEINQTDEPWVLEGGSWHEDDC
jgi:hypothetical protein